MSSKRPKLKDVAERAGVSPATVSIVLRGVENVLIGEKTRKRVRRAARKLGYRHNALAAGLRSGRTDIVAFILHKLSSPTLAAKVAAAERVLERNNLRTVLWHTAQLPVVEQKALKDIRSQMVSGVIVCYQPGKQGRELLNEFVRDGVPVVALEPLEGVDVHVVTVDREAGMYIGARHLLSLGHRRIAVTGNERFLDTTAGWGCGYALALRESGLCVETDLVYPLPTKDTFAAGYAVGKQLLASHYRPTALLCSDDEVAIGVMRACREAGSKIPDDLAVVGFDNLPVASFAGAPLTTISQPVEEAGRKAAELLLKDICAGERSSPQTVVLQPKLIIRESCGATRSGAKSSHSPARGREAGFDHPAS